MASILDRYGIKEVADVTIYTIDPADGTPDAPVLYLDSLKVSTIEQTGEQAEAHGGKGNPPLIIWDYGKEINVTLEDALFSPKSLSLMFGNGVVATDSVDILKTIQFTGSTVPTEWTDIDGNSQAIAAPTLYNESGSIVTAGALSSDGKYFATFEFAASNPRTIEISATTFPGTYYVTGDTYARSDVDGSDEYFQFIIPKAKVTAENTITLEAEGDPSVFNLSLRVLRPDDGIMMKLIKYEVPAS